MTNNNGNVFIPVVTCLPPDPIIDANYQPGLPVYDYNMTVNFTCNNGYEHESGDLMLRCDENADWVDTPPVCESRIHI